MIKRKTVHLKIECDAIMDLVYCQCAIISYIYLLLIFIVIQNDLIISLFEFRQLLSMDYYSLLHSPFPADRNCKACQWLRLYALEYCVAQVQ